MKNVLGEIIMILAVWGTGNDYRKNKHQLRHYKYVLFDGNERKQGTELDGHIIKSPKQISDYDFDYIIVATNKYYSDIEGVLLHEYLVPKRKIIRVEEVQKEILMRDIGSNSIECKTNGKKILFGYCFLTYENCRIHDFLLAESLRIRGTEIIPLTCNGLQRVECSVYGGFWGNREENEKNKEKLHRHNCESCCRFNDKVWKEWGNYNVITADKQLNDIEKNKIREIIWKLDINEYMDWKYENFPIGVWASKTYYNNYLISYKKDFDKEEEKNFRHIACNVALMCLATQRAVRKVRPDIIYSNDSFYYPFAILEYIAKQEEIPFYNAYGFRKGTYSYAKGTSTVMFPLEGAWKSFAKRELTDAENAFMDKYLDDRRYGKDMMINSADPSKCVEHLNSHSIYGKIHKDKKTALLASNVTWDAAALMRGIAFQTVVEWVLGTVEYFAQHIEWQLIIRAHPAEIAKNIPEARERIINIILNVYGKLPSNVILIDSDAPISIYDLYSIADIGLVFTSTVGLELSCAGIPVITVAKAPYGEKGFTYDAGNKEEYFSYISSLLKDEITGAFINNMSERCLLWAPFLRLEADSVLPGIIR